MYHPIGGRSNIHFHCGDAEHAEDLSNLKEKGHE